MNMLILSLITFFTFVSDATKRFYYFYDSKDKSYFDQFNTKEYFNFGKLRGVIIDESEYYNNPELLKYKYIEETKIKVIDVIYSKTQNIEKNYWGLDRINQKDMFLDNDYHNQYTGENVEVYIIDSGIETTHDSLKHNSVMLNDFTTDNDLIDYNGHGTHVAGIIGGLNYGVANKVKMFGIKVFDSSGSGNTLDIIRAMYVVFKKCLNKNKKCVINMSLGGPYQQIYNDIINDLMLNNIIVVVAAGNSNQDACNYTPAAAYLAVTVGSTNRYDERSYFSNWGNCVNIYAPGSDIISSYIGNSERILSGTSMASPIVTGVIAHIWSKNDNYNSFEVVDHLYENSPKLNITYKVKKNLYVDGKINGTFYLDVTKEEKFLYIEDEYLNIFELFYKILLNINYKNLLFFYYTIQLIIDILKLIFN